MQSSNRVQSSNAVQSGDAVRSGDTQYLRAERLARWRWTCLILCFFTIDFTIAYIAISSAIADRSFRPLAADRQRSVDWDSQQRALQNWNRLGLSFQIIQGSTGEEFQFSIKDQNGHQTEISPWEFELYPFVALDERIVGKAYPETDSSFRTGSCLTRPGLWQLELSGRDKSGQFVWHRTVLELSEHGELRIHR